MKRFFDIVASLIGLIILFPVFVLVALLINLDSPGPVFFIQKRVGRHLKPFMLYKFRTMVADAPNLGPAFTSKSDSRKTGIGRFLRKFKIDELPQLFNVLKGDMSLVGPRPEVEKYVERYREDYAEILKVRPGITDLASLTYRDEEAVLEGKENPEEYYVHVLLPEKIKIAKNYVRQASFFSDLKLIFLTLFAVAYPKDSVAEVIDYLTPLRKPIVIGIQVLLFFIANYFAFSLRFDGNIPDVEFFTHFLRYIPLLMLVRTAFLFVFRLDKGLWRYASVKDLIRIISATTAGSLIFVVGVRYVAGAVSYPRSVYIIDWFLNVFFLGSVRMLRRLHERESDNSVSRRRIIVIGAGDAAEMILRDMDHSAYYPYKVIGLVDDDPWKKGLLIRNVPVLGTRRDLKSIVQEKQPDEFLIAIPSAQRNEFQDIVRDLRKYGLPIKTVPSLWSILSGRDSVSAIKALEPEDVLFRAPVYERSIGYRKFFEGKRVMITGAGGSIGSELSRQVFACRPSVLILFERHEENLYKIDMTLRSAGAATPPVDIVTVIGDILDAARLDDTMRRYRPQIVLHAAAYKHVPLMEDNPYEAFKVNVVGTKIVAERALEHGADRFVLISTDKAVNPVNVMGMTKKVAEEIVRNLSAARVEALQDDGGTGTRFITVRFGNVLESSGSVVPLFTKQIQQGGPVTVTHPEMTRYFMTIPEAVSLVLQASVMGRGGEVFVLDMGDPVRILDLAKRMINLHGYAAGADIEISFVGRRPGEKLHEELFDTDEVVEKTTHPQINRAVSERRINPRLLEVVDDPRLVRESPDMKKTLRHLMTDGE